MFKVEVTAVFADAGGDYPDEVNFDFTVEQQEGPSPDLDQFLKEARTRARNEIPYLEEGLRLRTMTIELTEVL